MYYRTLKWHKISVYGTACFRTQLHETAKTAGRLELKWYVWMINQYLLGLLRSLSTYVVRLYPFFVRSMARMQEYHSVSTKATIIRNTSPPIRKHTHMSLVGAELNHQCYNGAINGTMVQNEQIIAQNGKRNMWLFINYNGQADRFCSHPVYIFHNRSPFQVFEFIL